MRHGNILLTGVGQVLGVGMGRRLAANADQHLTLPVQM